MAVPEPQPGIPVVARLMFAPVRLVSRRLAPRLSTRLFQTIWRVIDDDADPPRAAERQPSLTKLAVALDHVTRREFARLTGRWPSRRAKS